jgi:hypothetical protein
MNPRYPLVAERAGHRCEYCHAPEVIFNFRFEVEHIIATTKGGIDALFNLALACRACNLRKLNYLIAADPITHRQTPLYNPRSQSWDEHFEVQEESPFLMIGKSDVGRATIERLEMNSPLQLAARTQWIALGLFP